MEENLNENVEGMVMDIVEETTNKISFKETLTAYALTGIFVTGLATIGYGGYKGLKKLSRKLKERKNIKGVNLEDGEIIDADIIEEDDSDIE